MPSTFMVVYQNFTKSICSDKIFKQSFISGMLINILRSLRSNKFFLNKDRIMSCVDRRKVRWRS